MGIEKVGTEDLIRREKDRELLRERAEKLALKVAETDPDEDKDVDFRAHVVFSMGGDIYALETSLVGEVLEPDDIVEVPCTPDFLRGVVSVRGHVWSVVDLCVFFGLGRTAESGKLRVLLMSDGTREFGIVIDDVIDVVPIASSRISQLSEGRDAVSRYALGVVSGRTTVLDGGRILDEDSFVINEFVGSI